MLPAIDVEPACAHVWGPGTTPDLLPVGHIADLHLCLLAPHHKSPHRCEACGASGADTAPCPHQRASAKKRAG